MQRDTKVNKESLNNSYSKLTRLNLIMRMIINNIKITNTIRAKTIL